MQKRFIIALTLVLASIANCTGGPQPTVFVMEVTREVPVTVIVTSQPTNGPISLESATPSLTPEGRPIITATPSKTSTPNPFPTTVVGQVFVADQLFETGRMFWVQPIDMIWVIYTDEDGNNIWERYDDNFEEGMLERDPALTPPSGKFQPERGFGKLWREEPTLRDKLGWAVTEELGYNTRYEYHAGGEVNQQGTYVPASGYHLIENLTKEVFTFYEGSWTWEVEKPN
jgi:hypothetical protein